MFIIDWWNSMSLAAQIFALVALPSTLILLIQTVMMFLGMGDDADGVDDIPSEVSADVPEGDIDGVFGEDLDSEPADVAGLEGLRVLTVRGVIAFLVVFGWVGVVMDSAGAKLWATLPVATVCGFATMLLLACLMKAVMKLRNDGSADNRNAVGVSGKVHLTIPASRGGTGKVHIMLQGAYVERDAVTDLPEAIPTGSEIVVVGLSGQTSLVVRKK